MYNSRGNKWSNLLTGYDGQSITYDTVGNPLNYLGSTLTWQNGRELATFTNSQYSISYSYDVNGLRTEKAVTQSGVTTSYQYFYSGSTLLQERIGNNTIFNFIYTADGKPYALEYSTNNGSSYTTYYYLTNLQGDIVAILDFNGTAAVTYSYDSWGQITATTGSLATTLGKDNPLRYRGYVYDEETNLYYLQSRYYDPQTCRFINADAYASTGQGFLGTNCFTYCGNSLITYDDPFGTYYSEFDDENWSVIGFGIQLDLSGTVGFGSIGFGVEVIIYWGTNEARSKGKPVIAVYAYGATSFDISQLSSDISTIVSTLLQYSDLLQVDGTHALSLVESNIKNSISGGVTLSAFSVLGNDNFEDIYSYTLGFQTVSVSYGKIKGSYAWSPCCKTVGLGYSVLGGSLGFSINRGYSYYTLVSYIGE